MLGPWLTSADEDVDPTAVELSLWVNGELRQQASTADMVLGVAELIEFTSSFYTLEPGDVLVARSSGLGTMTTTVRAAG